MKKSICLTIILTFALASASLSSDSQFGNDPLQKVTIAKNLASMPLAFTENQGQWDERVKFRADAGGATMWFTTDGAYYQFTRRVESDEPTAFGELSLQGAPQLAVGSEPFDHRPQTLETMMIKATFVRANGNPLMVGEDQLDYKCNYFLGNDPAGWRSDVANYSAVHYQDIYPGIDLKYYGNGREMEYDFIVSPGADPSQIRIRYEGVESVSVDADGQLVVQTRWGEVIERRPVVYQIAGDSRIPVSGEYSLKGDHAFGFNLTGEYDKSLPLIIDPVLSYSTYLGGSSYDAGYGIAVDGSGCAYVTGCTGSTDFPTQNPYQVYQGGDGDAFVTKLDASGGALVYSTYLGGSGADTSNAITVDASGCAYITGRTVSADFPTENPYQTYQARDDLFVAKLSAAGNELVYSTCLGGDHNDRGRGIAVDASGQAYVAGETWSDNYPTVNQYQTYQGGGDIIVTKLNVSGNDLVYSTYVGGTSTDNGYGIVIDGSGNAYITGYTYSWDFPTKNPCQGFADPPNAFVTKLNSSGDGLVYSTYLGGSALDAGDGIAIDGSLCAYITGFTRSSDFPILNPFQSTIGGSYDAFVTKLNSSGDGIVYSTYLGGGIADAGHDIAVDGSNCAYVAGYTESSGFPTVNPIQENQLYPDAFVAKFNSSGDMPYYSTYLGGNAPDRAFGIAIDGSGCAYVTGRTSSDDFPTENPLQTYVELDDAFVTKISRACCQNPGDANDDGIVDILDFQYLRDYLHRDGPEPSCLEEADVNGDGEITREDMSCMARYLFSQGTTCVFAPCP